MSRCPFATWQGSPNCTPHGMLGHRGLTLHVQQGSEAGTNNWFHNPAAQASSHFGVGNDGHLDQWVDTDDKAWAQAAGNPYWISVETEGFSGTPFTPQQIATLGRLYAWLAQQYHWPMVATDDPNGIGLGWHGMGGGAWGGHLDCPGPPRVNARSAILAAAQPTGDDMPISDDDVKKITAALTVTLTPVIQQVARDVLGNAEQLYNNQFHPWLKAIADKVGAQEPNV